MGSSCDQRSDGPASGLHEGDSGQGTELMLPHLQCVAGHLDLLVCSGHGCLGVGLGLLGAAHRKGEERHVAVAGDDGQPGQHHPDLR